MDAARRGEALEPKSVTASDIINRHNLQNAYKNYCDHAVTLATQQMQATIISKDMTDFFNKRDDLLRDIFLDKLAGDMDKWKFASANSTHQVVIKGPKGWSIVGNQNEGQLIHDSKVIYRATHAEYQGLKPMAVSIVQVIQKAMDAELERLKTSLVEDLDVSEEYTTTLPSFLSAAADVVPDRQYNSLSAF